MTSRPPGNTPKNGETLNGQRLIEFRLGAEAESEQGEGLAVASAELLVRAETSPRAAPRANTLAGRDAGRPALGGGERARAAAACADSAARAAVRPALGGGQAARPLLRLRLKPPAVRRRRALDCDAAEHGRCCRQTYYVSFRALGWDDWIVAPEGYYANYCRGACAPFLNYHSQVVEAARLERAECCAPVRFSALSLIYFGADSNIIKRDLPEMVVEECDCP
ncbi:hypothetical protein SFRURICE_003561 [Spodoptera frugiperda]|nr:hypothetical protein SFRURICE_003561 [Spodoptera frugiperda]